MAVVKIPCPHCSRVTKVDSAKLPKKTAAFNCPSCKGRVVVDPEALLKTIAPPEGSPPPVEPVTPPPPVEPVTPPPPVEPVAPPAPVEPVAPPPTAAPPAPVEPAAPPPAAAPPAPAEPAAPPPTRPSDLGLPPGASLPPGFIVGEDTKAMEEIARALSPHGCTLRAFATVAEAHSKAIDDVPALIIYVAKRPQAPPIKAMQPFVELQPALRRRTFLVLVTDNLKTLDGTNAFFYQVNMLLNKKDIPSAAQCLFAGFQYHQRLYSSFLAALDEKGMG